MAYDKLVDSAKLDGALKSTADAIRAKTGGTDNIPWSETEGFKSAVGNIPTGVDEAELDGILDAVNDLNGSEVVDVVADGSEVTFGNERKTVVTKTPDGKAYFNGVLLPEIPADILASYPYCWIRDNGSTGYYDLLFATGIWYLASTDTLNHNDSNNVEWYRIEKASAESVNEWTFNQSYSSSGWGDDANRVCIWSNYDIPNGSATATAIYFKGSKPITEVAETVSVPVERLDAYAISSVDLNALGAITQTMAGKSVLMTVSDMVYYLSTVQFIPKGNAESSLSLSFNSAASGVLPDVQKSTATSSFSLSFTSTAVGELQEG